MVLHAHGSTHPLDKSFGRLGRLPRKLRPLGIAAEVEAHSITYLRGKTADESPCFYAVHYPPDTQGNKGYTDPCSGGHMQDEHDLL